MNYVCVEVVKIAYHSPSKGYAILLQDSKTGKQLPIIVGSSEAQAIALAFEGIAMPRPLTHDLLVTTIRKLDCEISRVVIDNISKGTYYAKLILVSSHLGELEIDSRPSDAIAAGLRMKAPIYVHKKIMSSSSIDSLDEDENEEILDIKNDPVASINAKIENLQNILRQAVEDENYEVAAKIRDRIANLEQDY